MDIRSVGIVTRFELARLIKTPSGILFLVFFGIVYGWAYKILFGQLENLRKAQSAIASASGAKLDDLPDFIADRLISLSSLSTEHSLGLVLVFLLVMLFTPMLSVLAFFEQTSSEVASKHGRFVLQRIGRFELFTGKALAAWLGYNIIMGATIAVGFAICLSGEITSFEHVGYALRIWLTTAVYAIPFLGLTALSAALIGHPIFALMTAYGYLFIIWLVSKLGAFAGPAFEYASFASPSHYGFELVSDDPAVFGLALGHQMAFAVAFFALGWWIFKRRDV